ncbi:hypothetical protein CHS0354_023917 [Potamilus streckersoni]|uniref:Alpha-MPP n=1 Tax=Potamilus streckersoni TaxID=2493646 RepID=A0AAE0VL75_9BIVA|nr:hypothetical protein CHS0354_023917 [Potamilus streckersoni]
MLQKTVLPSRVTIVTDTVPHVRVVSLGLWVEVGSRHESAENNGVAHFLEHLVFKGTTTRTNIEISRSLESVGGYLNAFTTKEHTCFYAQILNENISLAVDILTDLAFNATIPESEFSKEKQVIIEELCSIEDDPEDLIMELFEKLIYPKHPLGLPIAGTIKSLKQISRDHVIRFLADFYLPCNMMFIASEPLFTEKPKVVSNLSDFSQKTYKPFKKEVSKSISQGHLTIGAPFERNDSEYFPMLLLNTILGGGMSSRLNLELREKQALGYSAFSVFSSYRETNTLVAYLATDKRSLKKGIMSIFNEFEKLVQNKVTNKELELAKTLHRGGILMSEENMSSRMNNLARDEYYFGKFIPVEKYIEQIFSVTQEQILDVAQLRLSPKNLSTLSLIPN